MSASFGGHVGYGVPLIPSGGVAGYVAPGTCRSDLGVGYVAPDPSHLTSGYVVPESMAVLLAMLRQLCSNHGLIPIVM